jgi:hypothetical protein
MPFTPTYSVAISESLKDLGLKLDRIVGISTGCMEVVLLQDPSSTLPRRFA